MDANGLEDAIAIVGLSCRLPGAADLAALGALLDEGREGLTQLSRAEQQAAGVPLRLLDDPRLVPVAGLLDDVSGFDVDYFRMPKSEATILDPQHRLMLELAREALDDAGYPRGAFQGQTGIYVGTEYSDYFARYILPTLEGVVDPMWRTMLYLNDKDSLAAQVAYRLELQGPCATVQGVCATGLIALHEAVKSLQSGECDLALAGAVALRLPQRSGYIHLPGGPLSADGHTRSFDARGTGTVYTSGGVVVMLRRYGDALENGDRVHALIRGSAVYTEGAARSSFAVPTTKGHIQVLAESLAVAGLAPEDIQYIEGIGSATPIGDAVELSAIAQVYKGQRLHVGSLHGNLGHLHAVAGLAGLAKVVWSLGAGVIPATLHFERPNEALLGQSLVVNRERIAWPQSAGPRRAGVSALGSGGIYSHVLVEAAPAVPRVQPAPGPYFLPVSAQNAALLQGRAADLGAWLRSHPADVESACYTASVRGAHEPARLSVVGANAEELAQKLADWASGKLRAEQLAATGPLEEAARTYRSGARPDWTRLYPRGGRVVSLPAARWQRTRCWLPEPAPPSATAIAAAPSPQAAEGSLALLLRRVAEALPPGAAPPSADATLSALGLGSLDMLALLAGLERERPRLAERAMRVRWHELSLSEVAAIMDMDLAEAPASPADVKTPAEVKPLRQPDGAYESRMVAVDGVDTEVLLAGSGPALLLLPPLGTSALAWVFALPLLRRDFRVVVPSLPGLGQSQPLRGLPAHLPAATAEARVADHLVALLDALAQRGELAPESPVHVAGWSYGGCVAMRLALRHPRRVRSLTLACSSGSPLPRQSFAWLQALLGLLAASVETELSNLPPRERSQLAPVFSPPAWPSAAAVGQAQGLAAFQVLDELGALKLPTLIVCGAADHVLPPGHGQELARRIPSSELSVLTDAGHLLPATHAAEFAATLRAFVEKNSSLPDGQRT